MTEFTYRTSVSTKEVTALTFAAKRYVLNLTRHATKWLNPTDYTRGGELSLTPDLDYWDEGYKCLVYPPIKDLVLHNLGGKMHYISHEAQVDIKVSEQDYSDALEAVELIRGAATLNILKGQNTGAFMTNMLDSIEGETCTGAAIGLLSFLPSTYEKTLARAQADDVISEVGITSVSLGLKGTRLELEMTVIRKFESKTYNGWQYAGHDNCGNLISFFSSKNFGLYKTCNITAKINLSGPDQFLKGAMCTRLNYVKEVK